jgi:TatA/E family protein of Tat protein translocase
MSIGPAEIVIVLILALLVFGPSRLPQMGKSLGKGLREFRKAAETAKTEFGLGEVTDQINEVKSTLTEPIKGVTGTFTDLKSSVDLKSAIEAPVAATGVAAAGGGLGGAAEGSVPTPPVTPAPARTEGAYDEGPETPPVTPQTAFADVAPAPPEEPAGAPEAPAAPESPETVTAGSSAPPAAGA